MISTEVKYNNCINPRKRSSRQLFFTTSATRLTARGSSSTMFIDIAIVININNIDSWQWTFISLVPTPGSTAGTCLVNRPESDFLFNIVNIKIDSTTWQIENSEINKISEYDNIIDKQKNSEIDDIVNKKKADSYIKQNEFITEWKTTATKNSTINYSLFFLFIDEGQQVRLNSPLVNNKRRVNSTKFNSRGTSEEVKYNKRIDPYIGRGQVQQAHRPLHRKRSIQQAHRPLHQKRSITGKRIRPLHW